jgi:hypothetical protein
MRALIEGSGVDGFLPAPVMPDGFSRVDLISLVSRMQALKRGPPQQQGGMGGCLCFSIPEARATQRQLDLGISSIRGLRLHVCLPRASWGVCAPCAKLLAHWAQPRNQLARRLTFLNMGRLLTCRW